MLCSVARVTVVPPIGDGLQPRDRRQFPGAAHLGNDVFDLRLSRVRGVFEGDGPARRFAGEAKFLLQRDAIDLHHDAVGFVGERVALGFPLAR